MSNEIYHFSDVPGIRRAKVPGAYATSPSGFVRKLREHRLVCGAGDHGCIMVWRDDRKQLRGNFQRYHVTIDEQEFASIAAARRWLAEWLPKMRAQP